MYNKKETPKYALLTVQGVLAGFPPPRDSPGFLKASTVAELWKPQPGASVGWGGEDLGYGLGWAVRSKKKVAGFAR